MAIPDFPFAFGHLIPPVWNAHVAIHYAHRIGAIVVTLAILATSAHVVYHHRSTRELLRPALLLILLVGVQLTLGAFVVLSALQPDINTAHVVNGALVLGTSLVLTLRAFHLRGEAVPAGRRVPESSHHGLRNAEARP
jgi:cytochrome c oxidase assembly protein subunit 15